MKQIADSWHQYQEKAAECFRRLGFSADTDVQLGMDRIDVVVRLQRFWVPILWIVECKPWKCAVSADKVLRLSSAAQHLGADKGFLLSESGFQAGAVRSASSTNVVLTDLEGLKSAALTELAEFPWRQARDQIDEAIASLSGMVMRPGNPTSFSASGFVAHAPRGYFDVMGRLAIFEHEILSRQKGSSLIVGFEINNNPVFKKDAAAFFEHLETMLNEAEDFYRRFTDSTPSIVLFVKLSLAHCGRTLVVGWA